MPETIIEFSSANDDIAESSVSWWDREGVFIKQVETPTPGDLKPHKETLLIGRDGVPSLIAALQKFMAGHDSDCATHNEPAMPNGPCDCSVSQ
jgi:hypothetical protein